MTSAEDGSAARTTVPTEARTATHGPLEALVPQRAFSILPLSPSPPGSTIFLTNRPTSGKDNGGVERFLRYSLHIPPLGGASNGAEVLAGAKLCDSLVIESSVICRKEPSVFEGLYRLYDC